MGVGIMDILAFIAAPFSASTYPAKEQSSFDRSFADAKRPELVPDVLESARGGFDAASAGLTPSTSSGRP